MAEKRKRDADDVSGDRKKTKVKRGFRVGPENLPDGPRKRKAQKIKSQLIEKAQIKKEYAKVKEDREKAEKAERHHLITQDADEEQAPNNAPHPDRQTLIDKESASPEPKDAQIQARERRRRPKATPFKREYAQAQERKTQAEEWRKAREEAERQRQQKREDRERFQRAMAKARRGGPNGQRKLGRESHVLLEKVRRMVGGNSS